MAKNLRLAPNYEWRAYLDTNGDGTGDKNAIGDYSIVDTPFFYTCPSLRRIDIRRMIVFIRDSGQLAAADYGAIAGGLGSGTGLLIRVKDSDGNVRHDLLDGLEISVNADWKRECYDMTESSFGAGDNFIGVRWTFTRDHSDGLILVAGERFEILCRADMTGLVEHRFSARGDIYPQAS